MKHEIIDHFRCGSRRSHLEEVDGLTGEPGAPFMPEESGGVMFRIKK